MSKSMEKAVLDFFGFSWLPFSKTLSPKQTFSAQSYQEACSRLEFGLRSEDFVLLTGPVGVGKSVVLNTMISQLDINCYTPVYIRGNGLSEGELYKAILAGLDRDPPRFSQSAKRMFYAVVPELSRKPIVVVDDAHEVLESALINLKSMTNFSCDSQTKITFILSGQPELRARLKLSQFLPLTQRIRLSFQMKALSLEETCRYIDHHTSVAGATTPLFSDSAKSEIYRHAEGIPRVVNTVCYRSLISAAAKNVKVIDSVNLFLENPSE